MEDVPVISFDLDGTLIDSEERIHPKDIAWLKNPPEGCLFLPTTGRPLFSARPVFERNGLVNDEALPWPLVMNNGAAIYQAGENLLEYSPFPVDVQNWLIDYAEQHPRLSFLFMDLKGSYTLWMTDYAEKLSAKHAMNLHVFADDPRTHTFSKALILAKNCEEEVPPFLEAVRNFPLNVECSMPGFYEVLPVHVSKGVGLVRLLEKLGRAGAPVYSAGDGENDLSTFGVAKFRLAPQNALEVIRQQADLVVDRAVEGVLTPLLRQAGVLDQ